jgi:UDP-3-O-[3-hydroxymyristoyl] glucosamine N-acyltransferase
MLAVVSLAEVFAQKTSFNEGIHDTAVIDPSAVIGEGVTIGPYCVIGAKAKIGNNTKLHAQVVIYPEVSIGSDCEFHAGVVVRERVVIENDCLFQPGAIVGGEGFGYVPDPKLGHRRIPHLGNVHLGTRVDMGANSSVDRATFGSTVLGTATKIDSLVQVGHNNKLGERVLVCAMTGIGGSGTVGNDSILGGHVGVADHVNIASRVRVGGKTGVSSDIEQAGDYLGGFRAEPAKQYWRELASIRSLPRFMKQLKEIKKKLSELEDSKQ